MLKRNHYTNVLWIDFKKAFGTVSHHILWCQLIRYGIKGKFPDLIKSMYAKVKSWVRSDDGLTKLFAYKRGLRQGYLLSALVSALFLNDLNNFLLDGAEGIMSWDMHDLILVAESSADLQAQMDLLGIYTNNLKTEISQKKTKCLFSENRVQEVIAYKRFECSYFLHSIF